MQIVEAGGRGVLLMQQCGTSPNFIFSLKSLPLFSIRAPETRRNKTSASLRRWGSEAGGEGGWRRWGLKKKKKKKGA